MIADILYIEPMGEIEAIEFINSFIVMDSEKEKKTGIIPIIFIR